MNILGIESSCDECSAAVVVDGKKILSHVIASQTENHQIFYGVVPEIASRIHTEWIYGVVENTLKHSQLKLEEIDAIAVSTEPGLVGSLMVGLSFAKGLAYSLQKPLIGVNHIFAHLYACQLEFDVAYPFLGLLVSGGHTIISQVNGPDEIEVLGTTVDDACGEAFDKVAKFYQLGYPGGVAIDKLSQTGDPKAFLFPKAQLKHTKSPYDLSYSGLKTSVIHQKDQFQRGDSPKSDADLAASFQRVAIDMLLEKALLAMRERGLTRLVAGGGVAANSYLRSQLQREDKYEIYYPSLPLCTDNAAMIAGLGYENWKKRGGSDLSITVSPRVTGLHKGKPARK